MSVQRIVEDVRGFLTENYLYDRGQDFVLDPDASLIELQVLDSMGVLALLEFLERRYDIQITEDDVNPDNLDGLRRIAEFVVAKRAG